MPDPDPYAPFDRCGWTVARSRHYLADEPDMIRVSKGDWCTYLPAGDYASFDGDDAAFVGLMEHWHATAQERGGYEFIRPEPDRPRNRFETPGCRPVNAPEWVGDSDV